MHRALIFITFIAVAAIGVAMWFAFAWIVTIVYVAVAAVAGWYDVKIARSLLASSSFEGSVFRSMFAALHHRLGRLTGRSLLAASFIINSLTWPVQFLRGVYVAAVYKTPPLSPQLAATSQAVVPYWLGPATFLFSALLLIGDAGGAFPLKALALLLVAASFLMLATASLAGDIKQEVLTRTGNPQLNYLAALAFTLGCAALSRSSLLSWSGGQNEGLLESAHAILSLADLRAIATQHGLAPEALAVDPGRLRNVTGVPLPLALQALLGVLFYISFLRTGIELFGLRRTAEHYRTQGFVLAKLGRTDLAASLLSSCQDQISRVALAAMRLRLGDLAALERLSRKICASADIPFAREEEAVIGLLLVPDVVPVDPASAAAYLEARADGFGDPNAAAAFAIFVIAQSGDVPRSVEAFAEQERLSTDPLLFAYLLASSGDAEAAEKRFREEVTESPCARLVETLSAAVALLYHPAAEQVPEDAKKRLDDQFRTFAPVQTVLTEHWQIVVGYLLLQRARWFYRGATHEELPEAPAVIEEFRHALRESDLVANFLDVMVKLHDSELDAAPAAIAQLRAAYAASALADGGERAGEGAGADKAPPPEAPVPSTA